jgi:hypothetical protein
MLQLRAILRRVDAAAKQASYAAAASKLAG